jgi:hypothetical protein
MRNVRRAAAAGVMSALLSIAVVFAAAPANAVVQKSGSHSCASIYKGIGVRSEGSGTVSHYTPSGTLRASWFNATMQVRSNETTILSSTWKVTATGTLSNPGTFAYCAVH